MKKRWIVVIELNKLTEVQRIRKAQEIKNAMEDNAAVFTDPDPALNTMQAKINATQTAYDDSRDASTAATADYHTKLDDLERMMLSQANYVENVANADPDNAEEIIRSAAMGFKRAPERNVPDMDARNTGVAGEVIARMKSQGSGTAYLWEHKKEGETQWVRAGTTSVARFTYTKLETATRYRFRGGYVKGDVSPHYFDPIELTVA